MSNVIVVGGGAAGMMAAIFAARNGQNVTLLEKNEKLGDAITLKGGDILTLKKGESWNLFLEKGILNFYMPKKCTVSLYNNSGTSVFSNGILQVYETKNVILPDMPSSKYINYGWTDTKGSSAVKYELNSEFTVTGDTDFYIVRRTALQVNFKTNTGASNSKFTRLNQKVGKGLTVTMPQVPVKTGYQSLGWSKNKKASKADYKAGQNVTVSKTLTLYAVYKKLPYTVTFNNNNGTSTSKIYTSLTMYASKNQKVTLPDVPKVKGYTNLGWTTEKGETEPEYSAGDTVKITKATRFYAVRRKSNYYTVSYYLGNGSTNAAYQKLTQTVEEGTVVTFAKVPARTGYVNQGWSSKKNSEPRPVRQISCVLLFFAISISGISRWEALVCANGLSMIRTFPSFLSAKMSVSSRLI